MGTKNREGEEQQENLNMESIPVGKDDKSSTVPAGYRYNTPDSINEGANRGEESDPEEWYPADIPQGDFEETVPEEQNLPEEKEYDPENSEVSNTTVEKKPRKRQPRKCKEQEEPSRSSSRANKEKHNDAFAKEHFLTYVNFVAAQIAKQFVPQSLKQAIEGPEKDM